MHHAHIQAILQGVIPEVKDAIATATKPLLDRIEALESRGAEKGERGLDGKDGAPGEPGRDGKDGQSVTLDDVRPVLEKLVKSIPAPKDGEPGVPGVPGRDGEDGQSVTLDDVRPVLEELVKSIPVPKDGAPGEPGRDGRDADPIELQQVVEAIKTFNVEQLIKDAIGGEHELDIIAPDTVAKEMALAISLLAEPIQIKKEAPAVIVQQPTRPRRYTFEKDENNRVVAAVLEE